MDTPRGEERKIMARIARLGLAVVALLLSLLVGPAIAGAAPAPGPGNSPNAKACQKGGYTNLVRSNGTTFASEEACTSYAAKGGTLYGRAAAPCLNGGYRNYQTTNGVLFASQAECVAYVGNGERLVAKPTLTVTNFGISNGHQGQATSGTGLLPGSTVFYSGTRADGPVTFDAGTVRHDGTYSGSVFLRCGAYSSLTISATTAAGTPITADATPDC
jgi:hypothetical protein